jgi:hypothetical protein
MRAATDNRCVFDIERRTLSSSASAATARRVIRSRLRRFLADIPGVWLGHKLTPGVIGFGVRNHLLLQAIPPDRNLFAMSMAPTIWCRIVARHDGGCDVKLSILPYGFPWGSEPDLIAVAFFDDWLAGVASELGANGSSLA